MVFISTEKQPLFYGVNGELGEEDSDNGLTHLKSNSAWEFENCWGISSEEEGENEMKGNIQMYVRRISITILIPCTSWLR